MDFPNDILPSNIRFVISNSMSWKPGTRDWLWLGPSLKQHKQRFLFVTSALSPPAVAMFEDGKLET